MKRVEMYLIGLSYSITQDGSYVLILGEKDGSKKLPIIIKSVDAQYIAMKMESLTTPRPVTHDLVKIVSDYAGITLVEVCIVKVIEGIFYSKLIFTDGLTEWDVECSVGDAISQAVSHSCPIFCNKKVIKEYGFILEADEEFSEPEVADEVVDEFFSNLIEDDKISDLETLLEKAISNEEYEIASQLRDRINELKSKK